MGDSVAKVLIRGNSRSSCCTTCFDQQVAERDAAQPFLAVGDRIENRGIRGQGIRHRGARSSNGCTAALMAARERNLDKNRGSSGSAGWKYANSGGRPPGGGAGRASR